MLKGIRIRNRLCIYLNYEGEPGMSSAMEAFFQDFEHNSNLGETDGVMSQFAEMFLFAGPQGAQVVPVSAFALALPRRKKQFEEMGCRSTDLISLCETTLGNHYVLAETEWQMTFAQGEKSPEEIRVASTFIVYTGDEQPKIVFYLPQHDIMAILRDRGVGV
jgi:hypothetical protein